MKKLRPERVIPRSFSPATHWSRKLKGHPFRRTIAPHVLAMPVPDNDNKGAMAKKPYDDDHDWKLFVLSFAAFFITIYSFIS